jgi:hypothetical protein
MTDIIYLILLLAALAATMGLTGLMDHLRSL